MMDEVIRNLEPWTDQATKQMLQGVVKRKKKFDKYKKMHLSVMWFTVMSAFFYMVYLYKSIYLPYAYSFEALFSVFVNNSMNSYLVVLIVSLYGFMNLLKKKVDKYEKEFHALRCEIIDKSKDLWKNETAWKNRHTVFEAMKKEYDINLYHENK